MRNFLLLTLFVSLLGCSNSKQKQNDESPIQEVVEIEEQKSEDLSKYEKGTYGYDLNFLDKNPGNSVELKKGDARLVVSLPYQGRVMTSTSGGLEGNSYGWINYDLIESGEMLEQFNPVGGEERLWFGPEGGQFALFFEPGSSFDFENWIVPACIDRDTQEEFLATDSVALVFKTLEMRNYQDFLFRFDFTRRIEVLDKRGAVANLEIDIPDKVKVVGYESVNELENSGREDWKKETGLISIWLLGMFNPSPSVTMIIPYKTGVNSDYIVKDDYFGEIPDDRLVVKDGLILFKGDGKQRGKLGVPPQRAMPVMGSYDAENQILTIIKTQIPEGATDYVNSAWEHQEFPYKGDAVNAYNDGPLEDGSQLGPFYELESSSPALELETDESASHTQYTFHFEGPEEELDAICQQVLNVSLDEVKSAFQ